MEGHPQAKESELEWHILRTLRPNALLMGSTDGVQRSLMALMPHLAAVVTCWRPNTPLPRPADVKTLVIRDVDALSADQQRALTWWLEEAAVAGIHVVSTTTVPLYQRVTAGLFHDVLYYRLNSLMLSVSE